MPQTQEQRLASRRATWERYKLTDKYRQYKRAEAVRAYGITMGDFNDLLIRQGGVCAICEQPPRGDWRNNKNLHVDHDHKTGQVRGLLCPDCNTSIGKMKDSPEMLRKAAEYLEKNK